MSADEAWLRDMLAAAREAQGLTAGYDLERFKADRAVQLAVMHLIVIIGEAAARVTPETRALNAALPWRDIVMMRNRLVHH